MNIDIIELVNSLTDEQVKELYRAKFHKPKKIKVKFNKNSFDFGDFCASGNIFHVDGYMIKSNPSPIGGGMTVFYNGEFLLSQELLIPNVTNNETELRACCEAIRLANNGDEIIVDSQNTISWLRKGRTNARADLLPMIQEYREMMRYKGLRIKWEPRENNLAGIYNESAL